MLICSLARGGHLDAFLYVEEGHMEMSFMDKGEQKKSAR